MSITLTQQALKACALCGVLHPEAYEDPCNKCRAAIAENMRSSDMLDHLWFTKLPDMIMKLARKRRQHLTNNRVIDLTTKEIADIKLWGNEVHRVMSPFPLSGEPGTMTDPEWTAITRSKFQLNSWLRSKKANELLQELISASTEV